MTNKKTDTKPEAWESVEQRILRFANNIFKEVEYETIVGDIPQMVTAKLIGIIRLDTGDSLMVKHDNGSIDEIDIDESRVELSHQSTERVEGLTKEQILGEQVITAEECHPFFRVVGYDIAIKAMEMYKNISLPTPPSTSTAIEQIIKHQPFPKNYTELFDLMQAAYTLRDKEIEDLKAEIKELQQALDNHTSQY